MSEHSVSPQRLVVLISGTGTNLQAIMDAITDKHLNAEIVLVVSNRKAAFGLTRAETAGIPTLYFPLKPFAEAGRDAYDAALADKVSAYQPDLIVLAGWMHVLSPAFLDRFPKRVINLHPALPGTFPGTESIKRAYEAAQCGEIDHSGCMVHYVVPEIDAGAVIAQVNVRIVQNDTLETFEDRMHEAEHSLIVQAIRKMSASLIGKKVGILGGGQLGRMMTLAAHQMGMQVVILDPDPDAPAGQVADQHIVGDFRSEAFIMQLAEGCDVITTEIEHVNADAFEQLEIRGFNVHPDAGTIRLIQDKYAQKRQLRLLNVPVAPFCDTPTLESAYLAADELGLPLMLKNRHLAYDGRGNAVIRQREEIPDAFTRLGGKDLYVEGWIAFDKELAVMVAKPPNPHPLPPVKTGKGGESETYAIYPVVETIQRDNICAAVIAPARIPDAIRRRAEEIALAAVYSIGGAGIFGVEMFLLPNGDVLVNEIAPRPHNSGHYTIEACVTSQFEQHLRAILGAPLGDASMKVGAAVMINVLGVGDNLILETQQLLEKALDIPGASIHWYGKGTARAQRKMGHITVVASSFAELGKRITPLTDLALNLMDGHSTPQVGIIMGSDSDLPTMKQAAAVLRDFGVPFELTIVSAHRTPQRMVEYAQSAHQRGLQVIIAGAGGAAHLPGMVAALTPLPVIGVPIRTDPLDGQDALLSIVQMPRGVPVATVAIGNATNAALLAIRMLGSSDLVLQRQMIAYQKTMESGVLAKASALDQQGWESYTG